MPVVSMSIPAFGRIYKLIVPNTICKIVILKRDILKQKIILFRDAVQSKIELALFDYLLARYISWKTPTVWSMARTSP